MKTLESVLSGLGETPEEIASNLPKGKRGACEDCPVARKLKEKFPGKNVAVHSTYTEIWEDGGRWGDESRHQQANNPGVLIQFLSAFDKGEMFQDLVEGKEGDK